MSTRITPRTADEIAFLPAALEILETPPNPIGRGVMWTVIAIIVVAVTWACLGKVDIVAVAPGKLVPTDRVKIIQPLATGQVRAIHVSDGQEVKRGDVLIELDPTLARADQDRLARQLKDDEGALERQRAFAHWLETGKRGEAVARDALQSTLLEQFIGEHRSRLAAIDQGLERKQAELAASQSLVEKSQRTLPLITARSESLQQLAQANLVAKNSALELEQQRIEAEQDLQTQTATLRSLQAAIKELSEQRVSAHLEAQRATSEAIDELSKRVQALRQELLKASTITGQQSLVAPVDGVVQELKVHTIGGVVTPAEQLMIVVPNGQSLEVEAMVLNRDIGFVSEGQPATIKVDAFPFTRYGTLVGQLSHVGNDAAPNEQLGLVYPTRVSMARAWMRIDQRNIDLSPGMSVTIEIKTGQRRLIEYFLAPLLQAADESVRER